MRSINRSSDRDASAHSSRIMVSCSRVPPTGSDGPAPPGGAVLELESKLRSWVSCASPRASWWAMMRGQRRPPCSTSSTLLSHTRPPHTRKTSRNNHVKSRRQEQYRVDTTQVQEQYRVDATQVLDEPEEQHADAVLPPHDPQALLHVGSRRGSVGRLGIIGSLLAALSFCFNEGVGR